MIKFYTALFLFIASFYGENIHAEIVANNILVCDEIEVTITGINSSNSTELLYYSILDAANDTVANIELLFPVGQSSNTQSFCLPEGCYSFSVDEPINLSGIALNIINITSASVLADIDLPAEALDTVIYFGVNVDCQVGVPEIKNHSQLNIYPNPASDLVRIHSSIVRADARLQIIDMMSRIVYEEKMNEPLVVLSLNSISSGIYIVRYESNGISTIGRLEIVR